MFHTYIYVVFSLFYISGRYPYKSTGYFSEPEPNYDSDYSIKYNTLGRRRLKLGSNDDS